MDIEEFRKSGGRLFHRHEGKRVITVAYFDDGERTRFGAVIFSKDSPTESYVRKAQNHTAIQRCTRFPVTVATPRDIRGTDRYHDYIRQQVAEHGCLHRH